MSRLLIMHKIILPDSDDALLRLCEVQTYRSSGKGGQHVNTTDSAVRLIFLPASLTVSCQEERSQHLNKLRCLQKLRAKVQKLNYRKPKRIPTRKSKAQKQKDLHKKSLSSHKKSLRSKVKFDQ